MDIHGEKYLVWDGIRVIWHFSTSTLGLSFLDSRHSPSSSRHHVWLSPASNAKRWKGRGFLAIGLDLMAKTKVNIIIINVFVITTFFFLDDCVSPILASLAKWLGYWSSNFEVLCSAPIYSSLLPLQSSASLSWSLS